jgi:hypothetical protein
MMAPLTQALCGAPRESVIGIVHEHQRRALARNESRHSALKMAEGRIDRPEGMAAIKSPFLPNIQESPFMGRVEQGVDLLRLDVWSAEEGRWGGPGGRRVG